MADAPRPGLRLCQPHVTRAAAAGKPAGRNRAWSSEADDSTLLGLLDRHCYRCHSAVAYDVFDKEAVFLRRFGMAARVELRPQVLGAMPPDRDLDSAVRQALASRLRGMR